MTMVYEALLTRLVEHLGFLDPPASLVREGSGMECKADTSNQDALSTVDYLSVPWNYRRNPWKKSLTRATKPCPRLRSCHFVKNFPTNLTLITNHADHTSVQVYLRQNFGRPQKHCAWLSFDSQRAPKCCRVDTIAPECSSTKSQPSFPSKPILSPSSLRIWWVKWSIELFVYRGRSVATVATKFANSPPSGRPSSFRLNHVQVCCLHRTKVILHRLDLRFFRFWLSSQDAS